MCRRILRFKQKQKNERKRWWHLLLLKQKKIVFKKNNREKKMQRKEGAYLSSLASTFGMKHSSYLPLSTFLQRWAVHLPQALCPTSPRSSMLLKLRSSPELWRWSEREMKWGRYEGKILGQRRGLKNPWAGEEDVFLSHPQNSLNGLILNWSWTGALVAAGSFQPSEGAQGKWKRGWNSVHHQNWWKN